MRENRKKTRKLKKAFTIFYVQKLLKVNKRSTKRCKRNKIFVYWSLFNFVEKFQNCKISKFLQFLYSKLVKLIELGVEHAECSKGVVSLVVVGFLLKISKI